MSTIAASPDRSTDNVAAMRRARPYAEVGQAGAATARPVRVLLAAHNDREAAAMLKALRQGDFEIRSHRVLDGEQLLAALARDEWDLIVAEFQTRHWSGLELLAMVDAHASGLPCILVCGAVGEEAAVAAIRAGASDVVSSGNLDRLAHSVAQTVQTRAGRVAGQSALQPPVISVDPMLQLALDTLPAAIYMCDVQGRVTMFNRAAAALWGREPELGVDLWCGSWKIYHPDGQAMPLEQCPMAVTLRSGQPVVGAEIVVQRPDGERRHVLPHPQPLYDARMQLIGGVNLLLDVTGNRQAADRLLESEHTARLMFDHSPVSQLMILPGKHVTNVNDKFIELSGYTRGELVGRTLADLGLLDDNAQNKRVIAEIQRTGVADKLEIQFRRKDGGIRYSLISTQSINVNGVLHRLHSFFDVTEQRRMLESSRLINKAVASISQGVLISDRNRMTVSVNDAFETMTGYTQAELVGLPCSVLQGPESDPSTVLAIRSALNAGQAFSGELLNYRKDGSTFWNALSINPVRDEHGELTHFVGIQRNVTERRTQDSQIKLAAQVFAQSSEGVIVTNACNEVVMVNQAFTAITAFDAADVLGRNPAAFTHGMRDEEAYRAKWKSINETGRWEGETIGRRKDGSTYPEWLTVSVMRDEAGEVRNYVRTFSDLSLQQAAREQISRLSHYDPLTALPNRSLFAERCRHDLSLASREQRPLAMMVLGIDNFKNVNETLGNDVGDKLLRKVAARLTRAVRDQDTVARVGGDEFAIVLPGDTPEGASQLAERLLTIVGRSYEVNDHELNVSASFGVAVYPSDGGDFDTLFKSAQIAMHQVKDQGRASYRFFSADMARNTVEHAALINALRNAIRLDQLQLHYQPFVDLQSGRIGGMEALLRWTHPERGAISPAQFIPMAERSGLIVEIGYWVLRQACVDLRNWKQQGIEAPQVSVNLSPAQFRDPALISKIRATLQVHDVDPASICLELTEGAVMDDLGHSEEVMRSLKAYGLTLALDDFGTGYSSLSYLKRFPFDKVKIDQSFVRDINNNSQDAVIAKVVISMAHGLGLRVTAEGVETEMQCDFLRRNVCDEIQGYFFSRPVPAQAMEVLLREDRRLPAHLLRQQARTRTLLLVDDEPNVVAALRRLLRADGYRILSANSGPEGLELLAHNPVDIIVSDQRMPGMTGVQFLRQAKVLHPHTIRIVLSGHTELQSVTDAINEGAVYRFLTKPWNDVQLRDFIEQAFEQKELADENAQLNLQVQTANQELAASNRQLQEVLGEKQRALVRGEHSLDVLREALQNVPLPVLALDDEGMVAFANTQAVLVLGSKMPLIGNEISDTLPELHRLVDTCNEGRGDYVDADGQQFEVHWRAMGVSSRSRGKLLTLKPTLSLLVGK